MGKSKIYNRTFNGITIRGDYETIEYLAELEDDEKKIKEYINYVYSLAFKSIESKMDENSHYDITNNERPHEKLAIIQHCTAFLNGYEDICRQRNQ